MSTAIQTVTDDSFQKDVLEAAQPVLVDFWADWCAPCKALTPVLEEIARLFEGRITVVKIDIGQHQTNASALGIQSIPTLLLFDGGRVAGHLTGARPKAQIEAMLNQALEARSTITNH